MGGDTDVGDGFEIDHSGQNSDFPINASTSETDLSGRLDRGDILFYLYYYGIFSSLTVFGTGGNMLVIYSIRRYHHLRTPSNYFIVSLASSDLCLGIVYLMYNISHLEFDSIRNSLGKWPVCIFIFWGTLGFLFLSAYTLVAITVVRFISISDPLRFAGRVTTTRAKIAIACIWVFSLSLSAVLYVRQAPDDYAQSCRYEKILNVSHVYINTAITVLAPMSIMLTMWIKMTLIARKQAKIIDSQQLICRQQQSNNNGDVTNKMTLFAKELKMFKMAGLLVGYFTFAWTPFLIYQFVGFMCSTCHINRYVRATVRLTLHSNESVNVLIYAGRLQEFRWAFKKLFLRCKCLHNRVGSDLERQASVSVIASVEPSL